VRLVGVTAIQTASRSIGSKLALDGGLFLFTLCVSVGRLVGFRVVEGINPIGKIDIVIVTKEKLSDRLIQIAVLLAAND
jgi:hypothetical protein